MIFIGASGKQVTMTEDIYDDGRHLIVTYRDPLETKGIQVLGL